MDEYPFFFYQPWPLIISAISWTVSALACYSAYRAWQNVSKMAKMIATMRWVLMMQQFQHEQELRHVIELMGGELVDDGPSHTIQ